MIEANLARAVEIFAAINLIVIGLSHALQPQAWTDFFKLLHSKGAPGNFFNAMLSLSIGSLIVAFHNIWSGIPVLLTLYGWGSVLKGTIYLCFPEVGLRSIENGTKMPRQKWVLAGCLLIALGLVILFMGTEPEPTVRIATPR